MDPVMDKICISTPEKNDAHKKIKTAIERFKKQEFALQEEVDGLEQSLKDVYRQLDEFKEQHPQLTHFINTEKLRMCLEDRQYRVTIHYIYFSLVG